MIIHSMGTTIIIITTLSIIITGSNIKTAMNTSIKIVIPKKQQPLEGLTFK